MRISWLQTTNHCWLPDDGRCHFDTVHQCDGQRGGSTDRGHTLHYALHVHDELTRA